MKTLRAIQIKQELSDSIRSLFCHARYFHYTSTTLNEKYNNLFEKYPKDLPIYVKAYSNGFRDALTLGLYDDALVHGYVWNGKVFTTWEDYPEELKEALRGDLKGIEHGHYWKDTIANAGEQKPFFIVE